MSLLLLGLLAFNGVLLISTIWITILLFRYAIANDEAFGNGELQLKIRDKIFRGILTLLALAVLAAIGNALFVTFL